MHLWNAPVYNRLGLFGLNFVRRFVYVGCGCGSVNRSWSKCFQFVASTGLSVVLLACPQPSPVDSGTCGFSEVLVAEPSVLSAEGEVRFTFFRQPPTSDGATLALGVGGADGAVELERKPFSQEASWRVVLVPGDVNIQLRLSCPNAPPSVFESRLHIYRRIELESVLPQACQSLSPAGSEALDCDGVVLNLDGSAAPGRLRGSSRSFWADGGWGRWVFTDAGAFFEPTGSVAAWVPNAQVVVTERFAYSKGSVVRRLNGSLVVTSVDAGPELDGPDFVPCAAAVSDGRDWLAWCVDPFVFPSSPPPGNDPFVVCELLNSSLANCANFAGVFVGQDVRTREIVLRSGDQFLRFELGQRMPSSSRTVRPGEATFRAPTAQTGDGQQGRMYSAGRFTGFLSPGPELEPFVVEGVGAKATSELVWMVDDDAGLTRFSRLRPP